MPLAVNLSFCFTVVLSFCFTVEETKVVDGVDSSSLSNLGDEKESLLHSSRLTPFDHGSSGEVR